MSYININPTPQWSLTKWRAWYNELTGETKTRSKQRSKKQLIWLYHNRKKRNLVA